MFIKYNSISQNMKNVDILKATSSLSHISYLPSFYDIPHPFLASLPISTFFCITPLLPTYAKFYVF